MTIPEELKILQSQSISRNSLTKLKFSPNGQKLACASQDTMITVIRTPIFQNNLDLATLQGHNGQINSLSWSSNDKLLLSASADKSCIVWNLNWTKKGEKLLVLDRQLKTKQGNTTSQSKNQSSANPGFSDQIRCA